MECKKQDAIPREKRKPQVLIAKAEAVTKAYTRVKQPSDARKENQQLMLTQTWSPPQNGYAKVNADAATNLKSNLVGLGAIIRDENGKVITAAIKVSKFFGDVSFAEAEAIKWGMQIARDAHVRALIVESDPQGVVSLVNNMHGSRTEIYWVYSEIQSLMKQFEQVNIKYTHRFCNAIAHSLTKLALEKCKTVVWMGSYLTFDVPFFFLKLIESFFKKNN